MEWQLWIKACESDGNKFRAKYSINACESKLIKACESDGNKFKAKYLIVNNIYYNQTTIEGK